MICANSALLPGTIITDGKNIQLKIREVWVPGKKEKSNILILLIDPIQRAVDFTMVENVDKEIKRGDSLTIQGYTPDKHKLYSGKVKKELVKLSDDLKGVTKELKAQLVIANKRDLMIIPTFNKLFRANKLRAKEIVEKKCQPREEMLEKIISAVGL